MPHEASGSGGVPGAGGARQRMQKAQSLEQPASGTSQASASIDPGIAFKNHVARMFLTHKLSGPETIELIQKAYAANASGLTELSTAAGAGRHLKNARRDLMSQCLKHTTMPDLYWALIPVWNQDKGELELVEFPFLLPHELFGNMIQDKGFVKDVWMSLPPEMSKLRDIYCRQLGIDPSEFIPIGLHGDGVPHQKRKTVDVFAWNFIACPNSDRIIASCIEKDFCCKCGKCSGRHTLEPMLEILCWSIRCASLIRLWQCNADSHNCFFETVNFYQHHHSGV